MNASYCLVFTDEERRKIVEAFQIFIAKLMFAPVQVDAAPQAPASPSSPVRNAPSTTSARDRWARDRKGNELPNPEGCYSVDVHVFKAERKDTDSGAARMVVSFDSPTNRGSVNASCWDEKLFPFLAVASKEASATLHIVKNGKYLNICGVRA